MLLVGEAILFGTGCAGEGSAPPAAAGRTAEAFDLPFRSVRLGAGPQPYLNQVTLPEGREREAVTYCLVQSLQSLEYSIVEPPLAADTAVLFDTPWETDIVPLPAALIAQYNASLGDPSLALPPEQLYGLKYEGQVLIRGAAIRLLLRSILNARGARSDFRAYNGPFSGKFFADRLLEAFKASLQKEFSG